MDHFVLSHFLQVLCLLEGRCSLETHGPVLHHQLDVPSPFWFSGLSGCSGTQLLSGTRSFSSPTLTLGASMLGWTLGMGNAGEGKIWW